MRKFLVSWGVAALLMLVLAIPAFAQRKIVEDPGEGGGCNNLVWDVSGIPDPNAFPPGSDPPWHVELWVTRVQSTCNEIQLDVWISTVKRLDGSLVPPQIWFEMMWNDTDFYGKPGSFILDPDDVPIYIAGSGGSGLESDGLHLSGSHAGPPWTGLPRRLARFVVRRDDTSPGCTKTQMIKYTGSPFFTRFWGSDALGVLHEAAEIIYEGRIRNDGGSGPSGCATAPAP